MHKDYFKFFESLSNEERAITDTEKQSLTDAAEIWNYKGNSYQDSYSWAEELLG